MKRSDTAGTDASMASELFCALSDEDTQPMDMLLAVSQAAPGGAADTVVEFVDSPVAVEAWGPDAPSDPTEPR